MKSLEYDLRYIQAALGVLERYLLSDELFWPVNTNPPDGEPDYPRLTLDSVLLARMRLEARQKTSSQRDQVEQVIADLELNRSKWRVAWEKKANRCFRMRVRMWRDFIQEYQNNPLENANRYVYEVRIRVMIELLSSEISLQNPTEIELMQGLDGYLKKVLKEDGFIWEPEIQDRFPGDKYWYLYGKLPANSNQT